MDSDKSSVSKGRSYEEIGEFWDTHDLADFWDQTEPVEVHLDVQSSRTYFAIERSLTARLREVAGKRGVSAETLLNLWLGEKLREEASAGTALPE